MEYVNTLDSLLLMDASKARVWDMTFKLQYAKMELQKWRFQETPNASMQFELSTGFLIAECVCSMLESAAHIYIMPAFYGEHCMEQEHARNIVWNGMVYDQS